MSKLAPGNDQSLQFEDPMFLDAEPDVGGPENVARLAQLRVEPRPVRRRVIVDPVAHVLAFGEVPRVGNRRVTVTRRQLDVADNRRAVGMIKIRGTESEKISA